jgi:hypothetical protein
MYHPSAYSKLDGRIGRNAWAVAVIAVAAVAALMLASAGSAKSSGCPACGKNLILNPGAEAGRGLTTVGAYGAVPHWENSAGQFSAASWGSFPNGWFSVRSKGPKIRGKNYFFGGTTTAATGAKASIGTQTIKLPARAAGHKATLSGWLGNYGTNTAQVRAQFTDASGNALAVVRIGPDTTLAGTDMALRMRTGSVPAGATTVVVVVTFTDHANYNLAGADALSLVLS